MLGIFFFSLPIAGVASIQSISLGLFIIYALIKNHGKIPYKKLFFYKNILLAFIIILFLALVSLYFTPDVKESLKEIKSELVRSFAVMGIFFLYTIINDRKKIINIFYVIMLSLLLHTIINLFIWYSHGMWPYRAGGLLDSGGGERFGIWATYAFSAAIAMLFTKYKKSAFILISLSTLSVYANQTRATFIASILIIILVFIFFTNNKKIKLFSLTTIILIICLFYNYSENLSNRYNVKHMISNVEHALYLPPSKFTQIDMEYSTLVRLSMWKSVILYRLQEPFIPTEYGRFLYAKSIKKNFKNSPENLPFKIFAQTHNDFIGTLYSLGIIGLLAFIYILYFKLKIAFNIFKKTDNTYYRAYGVFIFLGTIGFIISMTFGSFFGDSETKFFYPLYGILLGIYYNEKNTLHTSQ